MLPMNTLTDLRLKLKKHVRKEIMILTNFITFARVHLVAQEMVLFTIQLGFLKTKDVVEMMMKLSKRQTLTLKNFAVTIPMIVLLMRIAM